MNRLVGFVFALTLAPSLTVAQDFAPPRAAEPAARVSNMISKWKPHDPPLPVVEMIPPEAVPAHSPEGPLALADLEALAMSNHPGLLRSGALVQAARGRWLQVGLPPNPQVGYSAAEIGDSGRAGQQGAFVSQQFITGGKLELNREVAAREVARLQREFAAQRRRVINDVQIAYFDVLAAQRSREVAHALVNIGREGVETAEALFQAKEASRVDALQAKIEAQAANIALQNAENRYYASWRSLAAAIAVPGMQPRPLSGSLEDGLPDRSFDDMLAQLISESPQISAAWAEAERARWALSRARVEPVPDLNVQGSVQYDNATNYTIAGLQVGVPLPLLNRNQGGIREAAANVTATRADALRLELSLQQQLAAAFEQYANARQQVQRYQESILPNAQESLDLVVSAYRQGELPYLSLLTAQRTYFSSNLDYIAALRALRISVVELDGLLLRGSLNQQP